MRAAGLVYVAFFALSIGGAAVKNVPLQIVATASYFVLAIALDRLFGRADPVVALGLLPLALAGCVIQGIGQANADAGMVRAALVPFGLFLVVLGYLVARSPAAPPALGVLLVVAGLAWPLTAIPAVPTWYVAIAIVLGLLAEGARAVWLLLAGRRGSRSAA